jgi:hypothetical protein
MGADLMTFSRLSELNAPVLSIGGAGMFDGIFVTGIVAVLIASIPPRNGTLTQRPRESLSPFRRHNVRAGERCVVTKSGTAAVSRHSSRDALDDIVEQLHIHGEDDQPRRQGDRQEDDGPWKMGTSSVSIERYRRLLQTNLDERTRWIVFS